MKREFVCKWKTLTRAGLDDILDEVFAKIQVQQLIERVVNDEPNCSARFLPGLSGQGIHAELGVEHPRPARDAAKFYMQPMPGIRSPGRARN